jgi:hypothetical protein
VIEVGEKGSILLLKIKKYFTMGDRKFPWMVFGRVGVLSGKGKNRKIKDFVW